MANYVAVVDGTPQSYTSRAECISGLLAQYSDNAESVMDKYNAGDIIVIRGEVRALTKVEQLKVVSIDIQRDE